MKKSKKHFSYILIVLFFFGYQNINLSQSNFKKAIDLNNMDISINPGDDFFAYVVGGWQKNTPIPPDKSSIWIGNETVEKRKQELINYFDNACVQNNFAEGSIQQKLSKFYCSGIDSAGREAEGIKVLKPFYDKIENTMTYEDVQILNAYFQTFNIPVFFYFYAATDPNNSQVNIANIWQKGTCLPNIEPFLNDDYKSKKLLEDYENYISVLFELSGVQPSAAKANARLIIKIEKRFAEAYDSQNNSSNKINIEKLQQLQPGFNWDLFLKNVGYTSIQEINILHPGFVKVLTNILKTFSVDEWKTYFRWNLINNMAPYLNYEFRNAFFEFNIKKFSGVEQQRTLKEQVYNAMKYLLRDALGQIYVQKFFPVETRIKISEMISNIKSACLERIEKLKWMCSETKTEAVSKLQNMKFQIGHPDVWPDFTDLIIDTESYAGNFINVQKFNFKQNLDKVGKPVDQYEWRISVMEPMAYNTAFKNEIGFCAGLIFPPEYYQNADDAVNYGAIGSVIGHEIIHFFDNEGKMYDKNGNLKNWWTAKDTEEFNKRTKVLVEQFNKMCVLDSFYVNGNQTLDENIAELGGLAIAYDAYKKSLAGKPEPEMIDGFTNVQRFFIAYAMKDGENIRDAALINWVRTNSHAPQKIKINGTLFNLDEFYDAFPMITPKNKLYINKNDRAVIF